MSALAGPQNWRGGGGTDTETPVSARSCPQHLLCRPVELPGAAVPGHLRGPGRGPLLHVRREAVHGARGLQLCAGQGAEGRWAGRGFVAGRDLSVGGRGLATGGGATPTVGVAKSLDELGEQGAWLRASGGRVAWVGVVERQEAWPSRCGRCWDQGRAYQPSGRGGATGGGVKPVVGVAESLDVLRPGI